VRDPRYLFDSPQFQRYGNLFWGDIYSEGLVKQEAADYVGEWHEGLLAGFTWALV